MDVAIINTYIYQAPPDVAPPALWECVHPKPDDTIDVVLGQADGVASTLFEESFQLVLGGF